MSIKRKYKLCTGAGIMISSMPKKPAEIVVVSYKSFQWNPGPLTTFPSSGWIYSSSVVYRDEYIESSESIDRIK